jgi:hypothetical protein
MKLNDSHLKYCPYYCEENIWHLCQNESLLAHSRKVVFISNKNQCVAIKNQKSGNPVYWDYHVVLLFKDASWKIADFDTLLPFPCVAKEYLSGSFIADETSTFRVVDADYYTKHFASDRRHMINQDGVYLQQPPPWEKIGSGFNLWDFVDVSNSEHGQLYDLNEMYVEFC